MEKILVFLITTSLSLGFSYGASEVADAAIDANLHQQIESSAHQEGEEGTSVLGAKLNLSSEINTELQGDVKIGPTGESEPTAAPTATPAPPTSASPTPTSSATETPTSTVSPSSEASTPVPTPVAIQSEVDVKVSDDSDIQLDLPINLDVGGESGIFFSLGL